MTCDRWHGYTGSVNYARRFVLIYVSTKDIFGLIFVSTNEIPSAPPGGGGGGGGGQGGGGVEGGGGGGGYGCSLVEI